MVEIQITYEGDLRCRSQHGPSGNLLLTDAPKDNHGKGEGFSPTDLVAAALGSCMLTIMGIAAQKMQLAFEGATARVTKEMSTTFPRKIVALRVVIAVPQEIDVPQQEKLIAAAMSCPVHQSLHPDIAVTAAFHWATEGV